MSCSCQSFVVNVFVDQTLTAIVNVQHVVRDIVFAIHVPIRRRIIIGQPGHSLRLILMRNSLNTVMLLLSFMLFQNRVVIS